MYRSAEEAKLRFTIYELVNRAPSTLIERDDRILCNLHLLAKNGSESYNISMGNILVYPNRLYSELKSLKYVDKVRIEVV